MYKLRLAQLSKHPRGNNHQPPRAFTLIEILVVVAIIALLMAILIPSLQRAREQAKLTIDKANCKQIATTTSVYQAEFNGCVPIILNYYANGVPNHEGLARNCWLSVAFRMYNKSTARMKDIVSATGPKFDPEATWSNSLNQEYQNRLMPEFFMCPFERSKGPLDRRGPVSDTVKKIDYYEEHGRYESYQTAMWAFNVIKGQMVDYPWPGGAGPAKNGIAKYSTINWNYVTNGLEVNKGSPKRDSLISYRHRKWKDTDSTEIDPSSGKSRGGGGLAALVTTYCAQGEHMIFAGKSGWIARDNVGSHRSSLGGGTNVIFGDSHVEWVLGTRMGWP